MSKFTSLFKNQLFKVSSYNSIGIMIRVVVGLVNSKLIAIYAGPAGMGLLGNLRNLLLLTESIGTLGFQNGIIKYLSEYQNNEKQLAKVLSSILFTLLGVILIVTGITLLFSNQIAGYVFGDCDTYQGVVIFMGLAMPWYILSAVLLAVINGFHQFRKVITVTIIGNVISLILLLILIVKYATVGAMISVVLAPAMLFWITLYFVGRLLEWRNYISFQFYDFSVIRQLAPYSLMFAVSAVLSPIVYLGIRNHLIDTLGANQAGYWEAMTRISTYTLMFVSTLAGIYYYPKMATFRTVRGTNVIIKSYYKWIIVGFGAVLFLVYILRSQIVHVLFTKDFVPVTELFAFQLIGDFCKAGSMILGYQFLAKKMTKQFVVTELISLSVMLLSSYLLINLHGVKGVVMAHAITYSVYWSILIFIFRKVLFYEKSNTPSV